MPHGSSRYGQTFYLPKLQDRAVPLRRRGLGHGPKGDGYDEKWLQHLLFETPEILPVGAFDQAFAPLTTDRSVAASCLTACSSAPICDLVRRAPRRYMSEQGRLSIVECKLWRNPKARREVVTQILDYAKEISKWSYEELNACRLSG